MIFAAMGMLLMQKTGIIDRFEKFYRFFRKFSLL